MDFSKKIKEILDMSQEHANVRKIFGDPIKVGSKEIVPVVEVSVGLCLPQDAPAPVEGEDATPPPEGTSDVTIETHALGFLMEKGDEVVFVPLSDERRGQGREERRDERAGWEWVDSIAGRIMDAFKDGGPLSGFRPPEPRFWDDAPRGEHSHGPGWGQWGRRERREWDEPPREERPRRERDRERDRDRRY